MLPVFPAVTFSAAVRLPLDGYCRPGRFFPVEIDGTDPVTFSATGVLSTTIELNPNPRSIVPMLVISKPGDLHWPGGSLPLRVPGDHEKLVASITDTPDVSELFPGDRIIPIRLDRSDPLSGPPAAWECLDAIVLDVDTMNRITAGQRSALLAAGVRFAVAGQTSPDHQWPWVRRGSFWVLGHIPLGPVDQPINADAYAPTYSWSPGWPATVRGQIAAAAILFFLVIVLIALFRNRRAALGLIVLSIGFAVGVVLWQRALGNVSRAGGDVIVVNPKLIQRDAWLFERSRSPGEQTVPWAGWTHPVFASSASVAATNMRIAVAGDGSMSFKFDLDRGKSIAFVRREVQPGIAPEQTATRDSPLRESVRNIYLGQGDRIIGETREREGRWAGVLVGRTGGG